MATANAEKADAARGPVTNRVLDAARQAEQVAQEARRLTERATEVLEDGMHTARRSFRRRVHELEDIRDEAESRIRRNPMAAIGVTFTAGLMLGLVIGWVGHGRR